MSRLLHSDGDVVSYTSAGKAHVPSIYCCATSSSGGGGCPGSRAAYLPVPSGFTSLTDSGARKMIHEHH